ncbi:hypothetical protein FOA52_014219 [Chlamydomonas sp. UWO 241]|nr:hypothetical protein FOA52_014219 [Chlamydomonas sp. UWO 241]
MGEEAIGTAAQDGPGLAPGGTPSDGSPPAAAEASTAGTFVLTAVMCCVTMVAVIAMLDRVSRSRSDPVRSTRRTDELADDVIGRAAKRHNWSTARIAMDSASFTSPFETASHDVVDHAGMPGSPSVNAGAADAPTHTRQHASPQEETLEHEAPCIRVGGVESLPADFVIRRGSVTHDTSRSASLIMLAPRPLMQQLLAGGGGSRHRLFSFTSASPPLPGCQEQDDRLAPVAGAYSSTGGPPAPSSLAQQAAQRSLPNSSTGGDAQWHRPAALSMDCVARGKAPAEAWPAPGAESQPSWGDSDMPGGMAQGGTPARPIGDRCHRRSSDCNAACASPGGDLIALAEDLRMRRRSIRVQHDPRMQPNPGPRSQLELLRARRGSASEYDHGRSMRVQHDPRMQPNPGPRSQLELVRARHGSASECDGITVGRLAAAFNAAPHSLPAHSLATAEAGRSAHGLQVPVSCGTAGLRTVAAQDSVATKHAGSKLASLLLTVRHRLADRFAGLTKPIQL